MNVAGFDHGALGDGDVSERFLRMARDISRFLDRKVSNFLIGIAALIVGEAGYLLHAVVENAPAGAQARRFLFLAGLFHLSRGRRLGAGLLGRGLGHRRARRQLLSLLGLFAQLVSV